MVSGSGMRRETLPKAEIAIMPPLGIAPNGVFQLHVRERFASDAH